VLSDQSSLIRMQMIGAVKQNGPSLPDWPVLDRYPAQSS
jgi:hypothetical protein